MSSSAHLTHVLRDSQIHRFTLVAGRHSFFDPLGKVRVEVIALRDPWLVHETLDVIVRSGAMANYAVALVLKDYQRAPVWIDSRFSHMLLARLCAY